MTPRIDELRGRQHRRVNAMDSQHRAQPRKRKNTRIPTSQATAGFGIALAIMTAALTVSPGLLSVANAAKKKTPTPTIPAKVKPPKVAGSPVVVGWISRNGAGLQEALLAQQYVNVNGGISGRPLKLATCSTKGTPASAKSCANQLISKDVKVVLEGETDASWSASADLFRASKTLVIGRSPFGATEYTDPNAVYLSPARATVVAATGVYAATIDNPRAVAVLVSADPAARAGLALAMGPLRAKGLAPVVTTLANGTIDSDAINTALTAVTEAAVAGGGPSALIALLPPDQCLAAMSAAKAQAFTGRMITTDSCATPATIETAGGDAEGWVVVSAQPNTEAQGALPLFNNYGSAAAEFKIKKSTELAAAMSFASVVDGVSLLGKLEKSVLDTTPAIVGATVKSYLSRAGATSTYAPKPYVYKRSKLFPSVAGFTVFASQRSGGRFVEAPGASTVDGFLG
jgi:branched-chain amino acid transport system substrate-binding protein